MNVHSQPGCAGSSSDSTLHSEALVRSAHWADLRHARLSPTNKFPPDSSRTIAFKIERVFAMSLGSWPQMKIEPSVPAIGRTWPAASRYAITTLLLALVVLSATYNGDVAAHIFSLLLSIIALSALLFGIGTSAYATALSVAALATLSWHVAPAAPYAARLIEIALFAFVGLIVSALAEFLHVTVLKLREANHELARAEQEKDLLLREASHRPANDLMRLTGLIGLELRAAGSDARVVEPLRRLTDRARVFTRVQERLLRSERNAVVRMNEFIGDLCRDVHSSLVGARSISIEARADPQPMQHDRAVLVGLIVNELVTNALTHAFSAERQGTINVRFECKNECVLSVEDDGVGIAIIKPGSHSIVGISAKDWLTGSQNNLAEHMNSARATTAMGPWHACDFPSRPSD